MNTVKSEYKKIPVTKLAPPNNVPFFRDFPPNKDIQVISEEGLEVPHDYLYSAGIQTSKRILPYKRQTVFDTHGSEQEVLFLQIENKKYIARILPEWGGRLMSLYNKEKNQELLYNPNQIVLRNLAIRSAWFAGGIEWNLGYTGHSCSTCEQIFSCVIQVSENERGIRIFNFDKLSQMWWQIDFLLSEDSPVLEALVTVYNDEDIRKDLYWWTNIAITEGDKRRVFASNNQGFWKSDVKSSKFQFARFPHPHKSRDIDYSYSTHYPNSSEFFFDAPKSGATHPWIATSDTSGDTFFEVSSKSLPFRKVFCWGTHQGGKNWQKILQDGAGQDYFEIQAGLAPTQLHVGSINPRSSIRWVHLFGDEHFDSNKLHAKEAWEEASSIIQDKVNKNFKEYTRTENEYKEIALAKPGEMMTFGNYTEKVDGICDENTVLPNWLSSFIGSQTPECIKDANRFWVDSILSKKWKSLDTNPNLLTQLDWKTNRLIQVHLESLVASGNIYWDLLLHLAIIYREQFDFKRAKDFFIRSLQEKKNEFAYWGLMDIAKIELNKVELRTLIHNSVDYISDFNLKIEVLKLAVLFEFWDLLDYLLDALPEVERDDLRLQSVNVEYAVYTKDYKKALEYLYQPNHYLREGEDYLDQLWDRIMIKMKGLQQNADIPELPKELDYRMKPDTK